MSVGRAGWAVVGASLLGLGACSNGASPERFSAQGSTLPDEACEVLMEFNDALGSRQGIDAALEDMQAADAGRHAEAWMLIIDLTAQDSSPASEAAYEANELFVSRCIKFLPEPPEPSVSVNPDYADYFDD